MRHVPAPGRATKAVRALSQTTLTIGAVLGLVCIVAALAFIMLGVKPLIILSGSMSPAINTGDMAFARSVPASDLRVGDVVSVPAGDGIRVTHRIRHIAMNGSLATLILKGDANPAADTRTHTVSSADRVLFHVPKVGYAVRSMSTPLGLFAVGIGFAGLAFVALRPAPARDRWPRSTPEIRAAVALPLALVVIASGAGTEPTNTFATFTDAAAVTPPARGFASHTMLPPDSVSCSGNGTSAAYSWPHKDTRYAYRVTLENSEGSAVKAYPVVTPSADLAAGGTVSQEVTFGDVGSALAIGTTFTVRIRSVARGNATWESALSVTETGRTSVILLIGSVNC